MRTIILALATTFLAATSAHADQVWVTMDQVAPY